MNKSITDNKREILLSAIEQVEDKLDDLSTQLENMEIISDSEWANVDRKLTEVSLELNNVKSEVYYS
ncbi:hypothetical protein [Lederbergia lenta]|uniref:hypothetical protein n=1 Tax=Lederbergia lenta TaxID=1467 RepID=UPI00203AA5C4|nr:hypothetical protein [Lederbergia lenta]MCM3109872.1 hypothetical protein [Lederbergia lenta]